MVEKGDDLCRIHLGPALCQENVLPIGEHLRQCLLKRLSAHTNNHVHSRNFGSAGRKRKSFHPDIADNVDQFSFAFNEEMMMVAGIGVEIGPASFDNHCPQERCPFEAVESVVNGGKGYGRTIDRVAYMSDASAQVFTSDVHLNADFATGAVDHGLAFGVDYQNAITENDYFYGSGGTIDLYDPRRRPLARASACRSSAETWRWA